MAMVENINGTNEISDLYLSRYIFRTNTDNFKAHCNNEVRKMVKAFIRANLLRAASKQLQTCSSTDRPVVENVIKRETAQRKRGRLI